MTRQWQPGHHIIRPRSGCAEWGLLSAHSRPGRDTRVREEGGRQWV